MTQPTCTECPNPVLKYAKYCRDCRYVLYRMYSGETFKEARERIKGKKIRLEKVKI
jgi:hypothetical protein